MRVHKNDLIYGFKKGSPVMLGYFPVSFAFGIIAEGAGFPVWMATLISLTNFTSAGQYAGLHLMIEQAAYIEIAATVFIINLRYMLMSFSISQKILSMPIAKKLLVAFGMTDEIFVVASLEHKDLTFAYFCGLIIGPYIGWAGGTFCGALVSSLLTQRLKEALGISLYAMFIAIIVPEVKRSAPVLKTVLIAVFVSTVLTYAPFKLSSGVIIMAATVTACAAGAYFYPREDER